MLPFILPAQKALFSQGFMPDQIGMSTKNQNLYQKLLDESGGKVQIISIKDLNSYFLDKEKVKISETGVLSTLEYVNDIILDDETNGLQMGGHFVNAAGYMGLVKKSEVIAGFIQVEGHFYDILPINKDYQFLVESNNNHFVGCANETVPDKLHSPTPIGDDECSYPLNFNHYNTCASLISVLLVFTNEARDWVEDRYSVFQVYPLIGQLYANMAFYNSDIPNKEIRVIPIVRDLQGSLSGDPNFAMDQLPNASTLGNLRNQFQADVAFVVVNNLYLDDYIAGGVSEIGLDASKAFGFVEVSYFLSNYTFAHELGHIMGCRHNWSYDAGSDDEKVCAHGKRHFNLPAGAVINNENPYLISSWRTIMGSPLAFSDNLIPKDGGYVYVEVNDDYRILHYSNPEVSYGFFPSEPTGRASGFIANNAKQIRNAACTVAGFRNNSELSVSVIPSLCSSEDFTLSAIVTTPGAGVAGIAPYMVKWYWSLTGVFDPNNLQLLGDGMVLHLNKQPECPIYWVKCVVTSADVVVVSRVKKIDLSDCDCDFLKVEPRTLEAQITLNTDYLKLQPNPSVNGSIFIQNSLYKNKYLPLKITDLSGLVFYQQEVLFGANGEASLTIPLNEGMYVLNTILPNGTYQSIKFINLKN
jgi:hypothetical protein